MTTEAPSLQDGWLTLMDALQTHRFHLQVQPAIERSADPDPATPPLPPETAEWLTASLRTAGLEHLLALTGGVVLTDADPTPPPADRWRDENLPWRTVRVAPDPSPVRFGAAVAAALGQQVLICFARSAPEAGPAAVLDTCAELVGEAVALRYLDAVTRTGPDAWAETEQARLAHRFPLSEETLDALLEAIPDPNTRDYVTATLPNERRFGRYRDGGGLGQH